MMALWEECKPCLKQTCMKFYARVCRSGSGLVGHQVKGDRLLITAGLRVADVGAECNMLLLWSCTQFQRMGLFLTPSSSPTPPGAYKSAQFWHCLPGDGSRSPG